MTPQRFTLSSRALARLALAAVVPLVALLAVPVTAGAFPIPQQNCNVGLNVGGYVCVSRSGPGAWVDQLAAVRGKPWFICDYHARFTIAYQGRELFARNSTGHGGCMYAPRATRTINVFKPFPRGSQVCATWYEGVAHDTIGTACLRI